MSSSIFLSSYFMHRGFGKYWVKLFVQAGRRPWGGMAPGWNETCSQVSDPIWEEYDPVGPEAPSPAWMPEPPGGAREHSSADPGGYGQGETDFRLWACTGSTEDISVPWHSYFWWDHSKDLLANLQTLTLEASKRKPPNLVTMILNSHAVLSSLTPGHHLRKRCHWAVHLMFISCSQFSSCA